MEIVIDLETRSELDLLKAGTYRYAKDPSTDVLCAVLKSRCGTYYQRFPLYDGVRPVFESFPSDALFYAHNTEFEMQLWEQILVPRYGFPEIPWQNWRCTAAIARCNNLPAGLDNLARALGLGIEKNTKGKMLINKLSRPGKDGTFNEDPELLDDLMHYCAQDVDVTLTCLEAMRPMSDDEVKDWQISLVVNDAGLKIDRQFAEKAVQYAGEEANELGLELQKASEGVITKTTQTVRAAKYIIEHTETGSLVRRCMAKLNDDGDIKYSFDKDARAAILDLDAQQPGSVPPWVSRIASLFNAGNVSSVAKYHKMLDQADPETDRLYGQYICFGAGATKRYSSKGVQVHNLPSRGLLSDPAEEAALYNRVMKGTVSNVRQALKLLLRYTIMPEDGQKLIVGDWTGIEARVLPWLADTPDSRAKLERIASGVDIYLETAEATGFSGNRPVGKVMELACGYQGHLAAFKQFAEMYGVSLPDDAAVAAITQWRRVNQWAVNFWADLESAALSAVASPEQYFDAGRVQFIAAPSQVFEGVILYAVLPDGSILQYNDARVTDEGLTALASNIKPGRFDTSWPRMSLYGGLLAGHCTQGTAGALLRSALRQCYPQAVGHTHDEIILEVPAEDAAVERLRLERLMRTTPGWAPDLILDCEPVIRDRYGK